MDDVIVCPNCGETNSADLPFCRNCQWRLHSLDSDWGADSGSGATRTQQSNASDTGIDQSLPEWLQQPAKPTLPENIADEAAAAQLRERLDAEGAEDLMNPVLAPRDSEDLLAGLTRAEQSDDEPIPDWVARIMGISEEDDPLQAQSRAAGAQPDVIPGVQAGDSINMDASSTPPWSDRDLAAPSQPEGP
ncbi:MAG TPA: zinc ribbon domain-containing protein, partial [Anaerolineales bacterium]|nr:zinc ribbon domain-containing protein [Anaerolineales bacterium]